MMLSSENLRHYCRTCLVKLEISVEDDTKMCVATNKYPDLEHLIEVCLARRTVGDDSLCYYAPFLCRSCFEKWLEFSKLYELAMKTDEKIRKILEKEVLKTGISNDNQIFKRNYDAKNYNEDFVDTETLVDINEIEKCGSNSQFYINNRSITEIDEIYHKEDDSSQLNSKWELENNNIDDFCSDEANDIDINSELTQGQKSAKIINTQRKRKLKKSNQKSRNYKSRKSLQKNCDDVLVPEQQNEIREDENDTKKVRYKCEHCSKYFWEKIKYDGHIKQVHEGVKRPYQCLQCDKAYNLYKTLLQHKRECHSEKSQEEFKCEKCDKIFKTSVILKQHIINKHSQQKESMRSICDQCGFIAAHQYSLSRHIINKHTETDHIKCSQCPKVFKTQYSLKYHIMGNHNPSNTKPFKCSECQMGFSRKTLLNQHKRTHLKYNERIKCDFEGCEVRFVKHGDKTHHMRLVHLKVKQHICDFCGEAFGAMQTLRHHRFIHTGEKPYKCNVCGQSFRQRTAMKTHRKTHFGKDTEKHNLLDNLPEINLSLTNTLNM